MIEYFDKMKSFPWVQVLGAVLVMTTSVHVFLVTLSGIFPGVGWLAKAANVSGVVAVDIGKVIELAKRVGSPKGPPGGSAAVGIVFALILLVGCAALQSGAAAVCQFVDSKNPLIGALCLSDAEAASVVQHAKASRALKKLGSESAVDICAAPLSSSE